MEIYVNCQKFCYVKIRRVLLILGMLAAVFVLFQLFAFPYKSCILSLSFSNNGSVFVMVGSANLASGDVADGVVNNTNASDMEEKIKNENEMKREDRDFNFASDVDGETNNSFELDKGRNSHDEFVSERGLAIHKILTIRNVMSTENNSTQQKAIEFGLGAPEKVKESDNKYKLEKDPKTNTYSIPLEGHGQVGLESLPHTSPGVLASVMEHLAADSRTPQLSAAANISLGDNDIEAMETQPNDRNAEVKTNVSGNLSNDFPMTGNSIKKERYRKTTSISHMNLLLLQSSVASNSMRPRKSSACDRQLQYARLQIESAPIVRNAPGLDVSLFRNFSMFKRSYELMENILKVYIYMEGEKPIFHQPYLRGIYASEGWFMKLMEGNKKFVVRDPRKAHLFYIPFSSKKLRTELDEQKFNHKDLQKYLKNYVDMIAAKYRFWNRIGGADHFIVACHDWASRITRKSMESCIRALCNSNVARGFKIGKDVSLPVTSVRSSSDPLKDIGGKPPLERPNLAFFAGSMHGYLRPILLQHWKDKEPDMKIFGPMPRDIEGKTKYSEYMKSSKYCICARGYEVHTPRVVESIFYECVPVIISDNYVPPFFEILNWEAFSVFIPEKDIPNLRNILLSIPEERYLEMQQRVKMVQQYFLWHKKPVRYDLFHMILHSVWYNRVFQLKT